MTDQSILLARQPIFDKNLNITAYELLFRSGEENHSGVFDGDAATSQVLLNAFTEMDIAQVVENHKAYINFTRKLIFNPPPFDKNKFVLEVLEDIEADEELRAQLQFLKDQGYTIALDDFEYSTQWDPILCIVDIVKLDVLALNETQIKEHVEILSKYSLILLAEKVETYEMFRFCQQLGFEYYQGYFLSRPEQIAGKKVPANKMVVLNLLSQIQNPALEMATLADLLSADPVLTVKVIRLVNSAAFTTTSRTEITSIQHAISLLGLRQIKSWVTLLALTGMADKPHALCTNTMSRAKMCQLLGQKSSSSEDSDAYFTTGLLSNMDAYFDKTLEEIIPTMPLATPVKEGLLSFEGNIGLILSTVIANEEARWDDIQWDTLKQMNLEARDLEVAYLASLQWATEQSAALK